MKKVGIFLSAIIIIVVGIAFTQRAQQSNKEQNAPKAIPQLEAERISRGTLGRGDTGQLTAEALVEARKAISTRSKLIIMEGVDASSVTLPITSERAKIAVFSPTDGNLDIALFSPNGSNIAVTPLARNADIGANELSQVVRGRGNSEDGVLMITERQKMTPGIYTINVRQSKTPIDIIVNDEGGPELNIWLSDNGLDNSQPVTISAKLMDGENTISGAKVTVKVRGSEAKRVIMSETAPGVYSTTIDSSKLNAGTNTFIVEAQGNTASGLQVLRHGSIDVVTGQATARLSGIGKEEVTATDLSVEVTVNISAAGRYYVRGNLLGSNDEPIAWAQDARELTPGRHTLTLRFAREVIEQSGVNAGFKLADVELMNTTSMPGVKAAGKINDFFLRSSL